MPRHSLTRCLNRRLGHSLTRRCARRTVRRVGRGPRVNYLAQALTALNRAVRARSQLARLAPEIFDSAVVSRREEERQARRQRLAKVEPILQKVYGPDTDPASEKLHHAQLDKWCRNGAEMVQFSPRKVQKIESLLAERELRMAVGTAALAWLLDLASKQGCMAVDMKLRPSQTDKHPPDAFPPSSMSLPAWLQVRPEGVVVSLKVQPRASRNEIGEAIGNELKVKVTAPPVDAAANEALVRFLAERMGCARNAVHLVRGATSRHKQVLITGVPAADIAGRLTADPNA